MATLSIVLIVKNEEHNLVECLETTTWADEIIILDAGSQDKTIELAKRYTKKVYINADWKGYGIQRRRAQEFATSDWILMLDADERITPSLKDNIKKALSNDDRNTVYALPRLSWCFGRFIRHSGWYPDYVTRLFAKNKAIYSSNLVHEKLEYDSSIKLSKLKGDLLHYTYRDLEHYLIKSAGYASAWAEQRKARGKSSSLLQGFFHGIGCFMKMYIVRLGILDGKQGLLLALLSGHSTFVKYADLWVRQQESK